MKTNKQKNKKQKSSKNKKTLIFRKRWNTKGKTIYNEIDKEKISDHKCQKANETFS